MADTAEKYADQCCRNPKCVLFKVTFLISWSPQADCFQFSQRKRKPTGLMQGLPCSSTGCVTPQRWCKVTDQHGPLGFDLSCTFSHTVHSSNPESESLLHAWLHSGIWVNVRHRSQPIVDSFFSLSPSCDCALLLPHNTPTVFCSQFLGFVWHFVFLFSRFSQTLWFPEHWLSDAPLCRYSV